MKTVILTIITLLTSCFLHAKVVNISGTVDNSYETTPDLIHDLRLRGVGVSLQSHPYHAFIEGTITFPDPNRTWFSRNRVIKKVGKWSVLTKRELRPLSKVTLKMTELSSFIGKEDNYSGTLAGMEGDIQYTPYRSTHVDAARKSAGVTGGGGVKAGNHIIRGTIMSRQWLDDDVYRKFSSLIVPKRYDGGSLLSVALDDANGARVYVIGNGGINHLGERMTYINLQEVGVIAEIIDGKRNLKTVYSMSPIEEKYITKTSLPVVVQPDNMPEFKPKVYEKKPYIINSFEDLNNEKLWKEHNYMSLSISMEDFVGMAMEHGLSREDKVQIPLILSASKPVKLDGLPEGMINTMHIIRSGKFKGSMTKNIFGQPLASSFSVPGSHALIFGLNDELAKRIVGEGVPANMKERRVTELGLGVLKKLNSLDSVTFIISKATFKGFSKSGMGISGGSYSQLGYKDGSLGIQRGTRGTGLTFGAINAYQLLVDDIVFNYKEGE